MTNARVGQKSWASVSELRTRAMANDLLEVRTLFINQVTKRTDLVTGGDVSIDAGADVFINAGSRLLDELTELKDQRRRQYALVAVDEYEVDVSNLIALDVIFVVDQGDDDRVDITDNFLEYDKFRAKYPGHFSELDTGEPVDWSYGFPELAPDQHSKTSANFTSDGFEDFGDMFFETDTDTKQKIIRGPPADTPYQIEISGKFYSVALSANTDYNYWTIRNPLLLAKAGGIMLEATTRDQAAVNASIASIQLDLDGIDSTSILLEHSGRGTQRNG
jgi:hypothetical protein